MNINSVVVTVGLLMTVCFGGLNAIAETIADFGADFIGPTNPHADTKGNGFWRYYRSSTINPSDAGANLSAYVWNHGFYLWTQKRPINMCKASFGFAATASVRAGSDP